MTWPDEHANPDTGADTDAGDVDVDSANVDSADIDSAVRDGVAPDDGLDTPDEGLLSRLAVIEDQPLEDRAAAFGQLYDGLRQQLEA